MSGGKNTAEYARIAANLRALHGDGETIEIRTLVTGRRATARYFDSIDEAAKHAAKQDAPGKNVYQTLNVLPDDLLYRDGSEATKDHEVTRRRWLMVDLDPKRAAGVSATDAERDKARQTAREIVAYLRKAGWPDPHVFDSGNGLHLLYRIDLPNDAPTPRRWSRGRSRAWPSASRRKR